MELDVCHFSLLVKQYERVIQDLRAQLNLNEEKESVKRREKGRVRKVMVGTNREKEKEIHVMGGTNRERDEEGDGAY